MFRTNIRIQPEAAEVHGLSEESMFEAFYNAPYLTVRQLSDEELDELIESDFDEACKDCPHYCKMQGRCLLDQDG